MSKAIGSIQSIESVRSLQSNKLFNDKSIVSDYQNNNLKKVHFETKVPNFLKNATNMSSLQVLEKDSDIMSQNDDKIEVPLKQKKTKKLQLNEGVVNFSPYQIALKNQMEMKGY